MSKRDKISNQRRVNFSRYVCAETILFIQPCQARRVEEVETPGQLSMDQLKVRLDAKDILSTFPFFLIGATLTLTITALIAVILHVPISIETDKLLDDQRLLANILPLFRTSRAVTITTISSIKVSVTIATRLLTRRIVATASSGRRGTSASTRRATPGWSTFTLLPRIETPGG